jgi:hypothetical protein
MVKHFWVWAGSNLAPSLVVCGCLGLATRLWVTIMGLGEGSEALGYSKLGLGQGLCQNFWCLSVVPKGGRLLHRPREIWCFVGHSGLGYQCGLLLPYLRALRPIMVTWLAGCAPPPKGERREGLLAEFVVLERVFGDPPPKGEGKQVNRLFLTWVYAPPP